MSSFACPHCTGPTEVKDSRPREDGGIRRRRVCQTCAKRFSTYEVLAGDEQQVLSQLYSAPPIVVKQAALIAALLPNLGPDDRSLLVAMAHRLGGASTHSHRVKAMGAVVGEMLDGEAA